MTETQQQTDQIKAEILLAAQARFRSFGYGKTTMAEIATDVNMSAANLYRYFHNKQDIAAECAGQCLADMQALLENVVQLPNLNATQRLHMFVQTALRYNFEMMHDVPRLNELIENITTNYPHLIHEKNEKTEHQIATILEQGVDDEDFQIEDVALSASAVAKATAMFSTPFFMQIYSIKEFEKMSINVVNLIITGLKSR
ncbi:MAG: TetR family transcriptional regulator [Gammaproteobacteria bacterium]|nr:MAG: TetR family transcriptional regulator [Gammaproteobacteria bacterium]